MPESRNWHIANARKNPYPVLDLYIQDWHWVGSIFNSYPCDLVSLYWFLSGNIFLIQDFLPDEMVNLWIFILGLTSARCQPHTSSIWPLVRCAKSTFVRYISTFVQYISRQLMTMVGGGGATRALMTTSTKQQSTNVWQQRRRIMTAGRRQWFVLVWRLGARGMAVKGVKRWRSEWD